MFTIKNQLIRAAAAGAVGVAALAGLVAPASAAQTAAPRAGITAAAPAALPNVNIQGSPATWNPTSLTVAPKSFTKCTKKKVVWTITNTTKKSATISYKVVGSTGGKTTLGTLPAGEEAGICSEGSSGTKEHFYIKGSKSVLTLTLS